MVGRFYSTSQNWENQISRYLTVQSRIEILIGFEFWGILRYKFTDRVSRNPLLILFLVHFFFGDRTSPRPISYLTLIREDVWSHIWFWFNVRSEIGHGNVRSQKTCWKNGCYGAVITLHVFTLHVCYGAVTPRQSDEGLFSYLFKSLGMPI